MSAAFIALLLVFRQRGLARSWFLFLLLKRRHKISLAYTNALKKAQIWLRCGL
jgi:hypothetical protein